MNLPIDILGDIKASLGENPYWTAEDAALWSFDVIERKIFRHCTTTGVTHIYDSPGIPASMARRAAGDFLIAYRNGLAVLAPASGREERIEVAVDFSRERFNDGRCDRRGRFFVGTMDKGVNRPVGGLWRLDPDRSLTRLADGMTLSNGIAWSPDDRTLYHCDSRPGLVYAYDYDIETGAVANRRLHIDMSDGRGHPDGCTMDAEGCLWIAEVGASAVGRYDPSGRRMGGISLPASRITSVIFGGAALDRLYITSMYFKLTPEQQAAEPLAGRIFVADPGVRGLPEVPFAG